MTLSVDQWESVLADATPPTFGEVVRVLEESDVVGGDPATLVEDALANGLLAENGSGQFAELTLLDDGRDVDGGEDAQTTASNPGFEPGGTGSTDPEDAENDESADGWEAILNNAQSRAGREWWEPVEEAYLREVLDEEGHANLLDTGELARIDDWKRVDLSGPDEDPDVRWYYARGDEPRPAEFRRFHELLTEKAPDEYEPWYFRVERAGKAPATRYGSWKEETSRLSVDEAVEWMKAGGNVGIAGTPHDSLLNIDVDDGEATTPDDFAESLRARSRSRGQSWHTWGFNPEGDIPNLPTDDLGEVRTDWQYVVAPGSFVASAAEEIPDSADEPGYYTIAHEAPVATVEYDDLPEAFREWDENREEGGVAPEDAEDDVTLTEGIEVDREGQNEAHGGESAVFDVRAEDLADSRNPSDRWTSLFHGSDTSANMSVSNQGKLQCWRHNVAHGGLQALATLSKHSPNGDAACRQTGTGHKHSNAGRCRYKGDWRLVWWAWEYAKGEGVIPEDDPIPYRVLVNLAVRDGLVDREELVERESDDGGEYTGFPDAEAYNEALEHVREEYDREPGREPVERGRDEENDPDEYRTDPRDVEVVLDPGRAWDAAGRVEPADLPEESGLDADEAREEFRCPECGEAVDVVRAVAVTHGLVESCDDDLGEVYADAYRAAREEHGAPLPRYLTTADAVAEFDAVLGAIGELDFFHLDANALESEITGSGDEVAGEAVRTLDPAWRDSESGKSVLVFPSGTVWDAETERVVDTLRFVALDSGLIDAPADALRGEDFTEAYARARDTYGAPLPRWDAARDGARSVEPMLPPAEELVDEPEAVAVDRDELTEVRNEVEDLVADVAEDAGTPSLVRCLPATGKTTAAIKTARFDRGEYFAQDETETGRPTTYLAPRKELQQQALQKAAKWGVSAEVLPVFAGRQVRSDTLADAVAHVREHGKDRLRDLWAIVDDVGAEGEVFEEDEGGDGADLDRPTCTTADGEHGDAWALAVHVARELGYTPRDIHTRARALFGSSLPCEDDTEAGCAYSAGWDRVADPDNPINLLVGSYVHFHVESARTYYERGDSGNTKRYPRTVVLDEFPGLTYASEFGDEAEDHAAWLGGALREDVADRRDLFDRDFWGDEWVRTWLDGDAEERLDAVGEAVDALERRAALTEAVAGAEEVLADVDRDALDLFRLSEPLRDLADGGRPEDLVGTLERRLDEARPSDGPYGVVSWVRGAVLDPLTSAHGDRTVDTAALPGGGELHALVERALAASEDREDGAAGLCHAAADALRGGDAGARELAVWADDGYAHPDAHHLLRAVITPAESDDVTVVETSAFAFDPEATDGTRLDLVEDDNATVLLDRNGHGAILHKPPSRESGSGDEAPVVGLDATGRERLWSLALGEDVRSEDVHDTEAERARFLRDTLGLQVVQCSDEARPYEGDPGGKDLDGDVALVEQIAEDHTGIMAPRERGADPEAIGAPAVITTKGVKIVLEEDDRLDGKVAAWENYGNLTGANDLGDHRLAALLGSQHYGDNAVERMAALAGEEADTSRLTGRGAALDYGSDVANTYLKHMREDQVMQAALRFSRGDSGATVFARTSALREDLPVVGAGQVVESYTDTATAIAREWRRLGAEFTAADVADAVDVSRRQVNRVLAEFVEAGYVAREDGEPGTAHTYTPERQPGAGEVDLPDEVRPEVGPPRHKPHSIFYTWNVGVRALETGVSTAATAPTGHLPAPGTAPERSILLELPNG